MIAKLNCPNCGAVLTLTDDIERFACGYCGAGLVQERRGGAIILRSITEAISRVQQGTDKTAAELALQRYAADREVLLSRRREIGDSAASHSSSTSCWVVVAILLGLVLLVTQQIWLAILCWCIAGLCVWATGNTPRELEKRRVACDAEIAALEARINEKKRVADGPESGSAAGEPSS